MLRNRSAVLKNHASMLRYGAAVLRIRSNLSFFEFFDLNWHFFGLFYLPVVSGRSGAPINRPTDQRSGFTVAASVFSARLTHNLTFLAPFF